MDEKRKLPPGLELRQGIYYARFSHNGVLYRRSLQTRDFETGKRLLAGLRKKVENGEPKKKRVKGNPTIKEVFDRYLKKRSAQCISGEWVRQTKTFLRRFRLELGYERVSDVVKVEVQEWFWEWAKRQSGSAKKGQFQITAAFKYAEDMDLIAKSPLRGLQRVKHTPKTKRPLSADEVDKFFALAKHCQWFNFARFLLQTCSRFSEGALLKWNAVDLKNRRITLYADTVKTGAAGERTIALNEEMIEMFREMYDGQELDSLVFTNPKGNLYRKDVVANDMKKLGIMIGRDSFEKGWLTPHILRHTGATLLANGRIPLRDIQRLLGHRAISTTTRYVGFAEFDSSETVKTLSGLTAPDKQDRPLSTPQVSTEESPVSLNEPPRRVERPPHQYGVEQFMTREAQMLHKPSLN